MSRRREAEKREILPDPKLGSKLIAKFVNHVMSRGKKSIAEKVVYGALMQAFEKVKNKVNAEAVEGEGGNEDGGQAAAILKFFDMCMDNIRPAVEVKSRRVGGATYQVPIEVRPARSMALAMRWLVEAAKKRGEKTMVGRLAGELLDAFAGKGSAVKKREDTHRMAKANQAFAHFRW
ncbi:MAG: 30S ribosomal protein S7 [marine bacterium B5-7]|nr:MAG: 30S ribosomal protein S7 [marine bacterium B5-7]